MQTGSGTLVAAIQAPERQPIVTVTVDWARNGSFTFDPGVFRDTFSDTFEGVGDFADLTKFVDNVTVDRSLSTDLPEGAKMVTGYGAASANMTLAGSLGGLPLTQVFASRDNPLTQLAPRIGAPVRIEMGMRTTAGVETLRQFTGKLRDISVNPAAGEVVVSALDRREDISTPVALALRAGSDAGLNGGQFMLDIVNAQTPVPPTSFDSTLNPMLATPQVDTSDPWELLQQLASAEQGIVLFDEGGTLRFYNRNRMLGGAAVATLTTRPGTASANLKSLASTEAADAVCNYVTVQAVPYELDPPNTVLWDASEVLGVNPASTLRIPVEFSGPVYTLTAITYNAAKNANGTGGDVSNLALGAEKITESTYNIRVDNPNAFAVYLVANSTQPTIQGQPYIVVTGRAIRPSVSGYAAVRTDTSSQIRYGRQVLDVGANPFLQSASTASGLADFLLSALREPHPTLSGVEIVGDPRLQLTDRVRVTDPDGLALDADHWLVGIQTRFSTSDGLAQSVTLREA